MIGYNAVDSIIFGSNLLSMPGNAVVALKGTGLFLYTVISGWMMVHAKV